MSLATGNEATAEKAETKMRSASQTTETTKTASQGQSRYGTPEPQIELRLPKGANLARALDALDVESLRELQRLLRDLDHEKQAAVNRVRLMPWSR